MHRDLHSPGSFDPAAYTYVGVLYQGPDPFEGSDPEVFEALEKSLYQGNWKVKLSCDHCGAHFHYGAAFHHINGDVIAVGHICANDAFGCNSRHHYEITRLKALVQALRERNKVAGLAGKFLEEHSGLQEALGTDHHISKDLSAKLIKYGSLSEKQVALAFKLVEQATHQEARDAERTAKHAVAPDWTPERADVTGTVLSTRCDQGPYGAVLKMLMELTDGRRCWGTVPSAILGLNGGSLVGRSISFTATFESSADDKKFAFYKRPTKAREV